MAKSSDNDAPATRAWLAALRDPLRATCLLIIGVSLCVSLARLFSVPPLQSANDRSRWCTVWSLVHEGTYQIDHAITKPGWDTIDKVYHEEHFYSTKPPLFPTLVAGLYWAVKATLGWTLDEQTASTVNLLLMLINLLPWGLALWQLSEIVRRYASSSVTVVLVTAMAAWGTLLTPFLSTLNNHVPGAICLIFALDAALRILVDGDDRWWRYALCGFFAAFTTTFELPAAAFGLAIFILLFRRNRQSSLTYFLPFALVPLIAFFVTNGIATGGLRPFYMAYGTEKYEYVYKGVPSYWIDPRGIDRVQDSTLEYLFHCTVGHHGLLSLTPILLVTILGWIFAFKANNPLRLIHLLGAGLTLIVLGFFLSRTSNYNYGGNTVALRWMLWLVPFWLLAMIPAIDSFAENRLFRGGAALLLGVSVFSAWYPLGTPWQSPWLFNVLQDRGWIDYRDAPVTFDRDVYSWLYLLPEGPQQSDYWIELASVDADGVTSIIRVEDGGRVLVNQRDARIVRILRRSGSGQSSELTMTIDTEAFYAGEPIQRWLLSGSREPDNRRRLIAKFLSGLPEPVPFRAHTKVYRAARVREDAFECITASARVREGAPGPEWEPRLFEARLVVSPEAPFGILRFETYVFDASGRTLHAHRRWAVHRAGKWLPRPGMDSSNAADKSTNDAT